MSILNVIDFLAKSRKASASCEVAGLEQVFHYAIIVINVIRIAAPIALIIWGSIDLLKGVIAGDEKKISAAKKPFIQRLVSAVLIFLIPWIVNTCITFFVSGESDWKKCYDAAQKSSGLDKTYDPSDINTY